MECSGENNYLDLEEGLITPTRPQHLNYLDDKAAEVSSFILKAQHPSELEELKLKQEFRRFLLSSYETYYRLHIPEFGSMRTLPVLREMMS